jgi:hypothetical protein
VTKVARDGRQVDRQRAIANKMTLHLPSNSNSRQCTHFGNNATRKLLLSGNSLHILAGSLQTPSTRRLPLTALYLPKSFHKQKGPRAGDYNVMTRWRGCSDLCSRGLIITLLATCDGAGPACAGRVLFGPLRHAGPARSYWFMNIVDRGIPDDCSSHRSQGHEVSNVAFFPAYPAIAGAFRYGLNINTGTALLITAQLAAWGFWSYFFLFCRRWNISPRFANLRRIINRRHLQPFFLIAGYRNLCF